METTQPIITPLQQIMHRAIRGTRVKAALLPHPVQYCDLLVDRVFGLSIQPLSDAALDKYRITSIFRNAKQWLR